MRSIDKLVAIVRERTKNPDYTYVPTTGVTSSGISNTLILEYLNAAQAHLQAAILAQYPNEFIESEEISLVSGTEAYTISDNVFANNKLVSVQYNQNNNSTDYYDLPQATIRDRDTRSGIPQFYIRRSGQILVNPIPTSSVGKIRVEYYRALDTLDLRRGTITSITEAGGYLTQITLTAGTKDNYPYELNLSDYVSVNTLAGVPTTYAIPVSTYTAATGILAMPATTFPAGATIAAGSYVTIGNYSTTHSKLPDNCERYLISYAAKRVLTTDTSESSIEEDAELKMIETDILQSFANESRDITYYPILDYEIMN